MAEGDLTGRLKYGEVAGIGWKDGLGQVVKVLEGWLKEVQFFILRVIRAMDGFKQGGDIMRFALQR